MKTKEQMEMERKATFDRLERRLNETVSLEDRLFIIIPMKIISFYRMPCSG